MSVEAQSLVIIGGSSGMGLAICKRAVDAGADVTIAGRSRTRLDKTRQAIPGMLPAALSIYRTKTP